MLYTKIQPQSILGSGEAFYVFFTIYGHDGLLVLWRISIQTNCQYSFERRPHVQSGEKCLRAFRGEDI